MTRKMKDSGIEWIGDIPEDWKTVRVKNLFDVSRGRVISKLETTDDGKYPVYSSQTENDGIFGYIDTFDYSGEALTWTTDGEKAGTVFYRNGKYNCTNICGILQKKQDSIYKTDIKYLFYAIRMVAEENKRPDTNGHKIMSNEMERLSIPITNYDEQVKIGLTLDEKSRNIDNTLSLIKEEIESLKNYKKSAITEAVTKGLDKNVEMKDSGIEWIGEIPKHWEVVKGKYILNLLKRLVRDTDEVITCFRDGEVTLRSNRREDGFTFSDKEIGYQGINAGDLVVHGMDGFAGAIGISDSRGKGSPVLNVIDSSENKKYLMYYLRIMAYSDVFTALATGIRVRSVDLRWNKLANLFYPLPRNNEQNDIVDYLDKKTKLIDDSIAVKQKQLEILEEYKKSLIYEYVTGKKEVNDGEES